MCRVFQEKRGIKAKDRADKKGTVDFVLPLDKKTENWSKHRIWPCAGVNLDGASYLFFARILFTGKGQWGFNKMESAWPVPRKIPGNSSGSCTESDPPLPIAPQSIIAKPDGNVHLYYLEKIGRTNSGVFVAKVPSRKIAQPKEYQYWCGPQGDRPPFQDPGQSGGRGCPGAGVRGLE